MEFKLVKTKLFDGISSGSALEYYGGNLFVAGDDARCLHVLDKKWQRIRTIRLFEGPADERMPKKEKSDIEAMALIEVDTRPTLLLLGSGSRDCRNVAILLDISNEALRRLALDKFYGRLRDLGLKELNIEGATIVQDRLVLSNRGHKRNPANQLIVTDVDFYQRQDTAAIQIVSLTLDPLLRQASVSGLAYSRSDDCLFLALSTEDVSNTYDDGPIGKSYIAFLMHPQERFRHSEDGVRFDGFIDLAAQDDRFHGNKVESVCIQSEKADRMKLHLVADNDTGLSRLFKVTLRP